MSLLVVGTVAYDSIETPTESRERIMGGSASYFSIAANFFTDVSLVAVVGGDMEQSKLDEFQKRNIDCSGLEIRPNEKSFFWAGKYLPNMNDRETLDTQLNVLADFKPVLSETAQKSNCLFLANGSVDLQLNVLSQWKGDGICMADTMNLWINIQRDLLDELMKKVDGLILNDSEAILLTGDSNTVSAARKILTMGPKFVVVKKGEHGVIFCSKTQTYALPAFPLDSVVDPTGAGDSFAGGLMGYLASKNCTAEELDGKTVKEAMAYATVVASYTCGDFSWDNLLRLNRQDIEARLAEYKDLFEF